jgi:hypothetical protein
MCLLSYPSAGINAVGAWFDYTWAGTTCSDTLTKPSGSSAQVCFSGGKCTGSMPGAGLGLSLCDIAGVNVSTWPQMQGLISTHGLSTTGESTFSQCNTGAVMTSVNWELGSGSIPAGTQLIFESAASQPLGQVVLTAGATSAAIPSSVDATKIAAVQFSFNAATIPSWNFCLSSVTISYQ